LVFSASLAHNVNVSIGSLTLALKITHDRFGSNEFFAHFVGAF
jgi:hypothetical protein